MAAKSAASTALDTLKQLGIDDPADALHDLISEQLRSLATEASDGLPIEGPLRGLPTGQIELTLDDKVIRFRPVTIGDLLALDTATEEGVTTLGWWRKASTILGDSELPADELLPPWLARETWPSRARNFWNQVPTQAPGS